MLLIMSITMVAVEFIYILLNVFFRWPVKELVRLPQLDWSRTTFALRKILFHILQQNLYRQTY